MKDLRKYLVDILDTIAGIEEIAKGIKISDVHDYDLVDKEQIFAIVQKHLPILKTEVETILKSLQ